MQDKIYEKLHFMTDNIKTNMKHRLDYIHCIPANIKILLWATKISEHGTVLTAPEDEAVPGFLGFLPFTLTLVQGKEWTDHISSPTEVPSGTSL